MENNAYKRTRMSLLHDKVLDSICFKGTRSDHTSFQTLINKTVHDILANTTAHGKIGSSDMLGLCNISAAARDRPLTKKKEEPTT